VDKVLIDHFLNPRNVGDAGEPRFSGRTASFTCGAVAHLSIQIDESHNISQAKFRAAGCETLIGCLSMLTNRVQHQSTSDAALVGLDVTSLMNEFEIEPDRRHCVQLACDALVSAVQEYSNAARDEWNGDEALICTCFFVSERTIEQEIKEKGLTTVREVTAACNAGGGCGSCQQLILEILDTSLDL
jgi:NifU-like protein